jgi:DNA-binding MarR family transcriptional regulator
MAGVTEALPRSGRAPLSTLSSHALVAFAVEVDNEFEHQMPHRTTRHGSTPGSHRAPWLVSMAMWVNCMRYVPDDGIAAGELARRARLTPKSVQTVVKRMCQWWGYLVVEPDPTDTRAKPPHSAWLVRPTSAGRQAQRVWEPLVGLVEDRWRARFGHEETERLRTSLHGIVSQLDLELPDYLPVGEPLLGPRPARDDDAGSDSTLPALLSKVLLAFALDFERESDLSLGIYTSGGTSRLGVSANILRVLSAQGVRVADIPTRTGVAKMAIDNWVGTLEEHRYLTVGPDPTGSRFKVAKLTPKGRKAQDAYFRWTDGVDHRWEDRFGSRALRALRDSIEPLVDGPGADSPLWRSTDPYPDGWRAQVARPETLPHYPVVSARGGFPDGSCDRDAARGRPRAALPYRPRLVGLLADDEISSMADRHRTPTGLLANPDGGARSAVPPGPDAPPAPKETGSTPLGCNGARSRAN